MSEIKAPALLGKLLQQAEFVRNVHAVSVPPGVALQSVLDPAFWVHVAHRIKVHDKVEVRAQDGAWYAELMVAKVDPAAVRMWTLNYVDLRAQDKTAPALLADDYFVQMGGPHRWRVLRKADRKVLHIGEATEAAATEWLEKFIAGVVVPDFNADKAEA